MGTEPHKLKLVRTWETGWEQYICRVCGRLSLWLSMPDQVFAIQLVRGERKVDHILPDGRSESRRWLDEEQAILKRRQEKQKQQLEQMLTLGKLAHEHGGDEPELDEQWRDAIEGLDFGDEPEEGPGAPEGVV